MARKANMEGYRLNKREKEKLRKKEKAAKGAAGFSFNGMIAAIGDAVLSVIPKSRKAKASAASALQAAPLQKKVQFSHSYLRYFG